MRVHSDSLISEFKVGYLKADIQSLPLNYGTNLSQQFGIPGVNVDDVTSGLALMTLTGFSALGDSTFIPLIQIDDTWQFNGSVTKTFGAHNIKVGAAYIARQFVVFQSASPVGNFTFNTQLTDNGAGVGGNAIASFLLGYPSQVARSHSLIYPHYQTNEPSAFVQDDWRATDWLTLNLGVRYDVFTPLHRTGRADLQLRCGQRQDSPRRSGWRVDQRGRRDRLFEHRAAPGVLGDAAGDRWWCAAGSAWPTSRATTCRSRS